MLGLYCGAVSGWAREEGLVGRRSGVLGGVKARGPFHIPSNCFRGLASRMVGQLPRGRGLATMRARPAV